MKYSLVIYYLLLPLMIIGISKQAVSATLPTTRTNDLYTPLHIDSSQCKEQLSDNLDNIKEYFQLTDTKDNIHQYYLMTCMGSYQKNFLSDNQELPTDREELMSKKDMIAKKLADGFIDCLEKSQSRIMEKKMSGTTINYYMPSGAEIYTALTPHKLMSIEQVEENSQSIIDLLIIKNDQIGSDLKKLDRKSVASYLYSKVGIPTENFLRNMNHIDHKVNCYCELSDNKKTPLRRLTDFTSLLITSAQYHELAAEKLIEKVSELLIITITEWLTKPENIHPCFKKGCDSIFWYTIARISVTHDEKVHDSYQSGKMSHWFELGAENSDKTRELIKSFKEYMKNDTCLKYKLKFKDL
ncbi:hypothetical protein [Endozoicomonas euniceicola]|uniref:Uncharacterized protein n=1 Tax=Endozoicomonas euniceicola TaxID=1234143 RepID=A0ABY6GUI7_9GAMM|nr:hypothetical protein [Endozoicomonas euniceicola]UYM15721.1 hypothetical protein NX720_23305 [Endozoicomonas euniceicola]